MGNDDQPYLLDNIPALPDPMVFKGSNYDKKRDQKRLQAQARRIYEFMQDGEWKTLRQIEDATGDPPASISAQLRHLRRYGYAVVKRHLGHGLWEYQIIVGGE